MRQHALVCLATAASLLTGCSRPDPVAIKYKWEKGHVLKQRMTMESSSKMQMTGNSATPPGMNFDSSMTMTQDAQLRVLDVKPDGLATVEMTYTHGMVSMDGPMGSFSVDSSEPPPAGDPKSPNAVMVKSMKPMLDAYNGKPITFDIDAQGNVPRVTGMKAIADRMSASGSPAAAGIMGMFDDETMRKTLQQYFRGWDSKPLSVGDSWEVQNEQAMPMMGTIKSTEKRTLKSISTIDGRRMATVISAFTIPAQKLGNKGQTRPPGTPEFDFDLPESTGKGEHVFDLDWGRLHRTSTSILMPIDMPMPTGGQLKMTITTKTTLEAINQ